MNNLLSYCGLVDGKIRPSDKDLPVQLVFLRPFEMQVKQDFPINDGSFPNVTLCSHRMFDKKRIAGLFFINT